MSDVFISYKQDERERMRPIAEGLRALGVDVWFDERLQPDRSFTEEIHHVMTACKAQIVCWSPLAIASEWVRGEAEVARQRGVLVAVIIEPCTLLPPFNMHHAESLVGWTGDPKHSGWRKLCDVVGRKLDRAGLGELAALQGSADGAAWKKWAQKFPNDPLAEAAWAKAEELEIEAARERVARDREEAKRKEAELARVKLEQEQKPPKSIGPKEPPSPVQRRESPSPSSSPRRGHTGLVFAAIGAVLVIGALAFLAPKFLPSPSQTAETPVTTAEAVEAPASTPLDTAGAAPATTEPTTPDPAASAIAAIERVPARIWSKEDAPTVVYSVLRNTDFASLRAAARSDPRAQVVLGEALQFGLGVDRDIAAAVHMIRRAQAGANARASYDLGYMYASGNGVNRDYAEAYRLYRIAADRGIARAQNEIGVAMAHGLNDVPADREQGMRYMRLAVDQNYATAGQNLAYFYDDRDPERGRLLALPDSDSNLRDAALEFFGVR